MNNKLYKKFIKDGRSDAEILNIIGTFFDENLDLMCILNLDGSFFKVNSSWVDVLGYSLCDLKDSIVTDYVHPQDKDLVAFSMQKIKEKEENSIIELRYKSKNGEYKNLEFKVHMLYDMYFISARDVTSWHLTRDLLKKSKFDMQQSLRLQKMVSQTALSLMVAEDFSTQLIESVSEVCKFLHIDRFLFFIDDDDKNKSILKYSWSNLSSDETHPKEDTMTYRAIASYKSFLEKTGIIFSKDLKNLPAELREYLEQNSISSVAIFPIHIDSQVKGFIRFDCFDKVNKCDDSVIQSLQTLISIISTEYAKRLLDLRFKESHKTLDMFFDNSKDGFLFMTLDKPILWTAQSDKDKLLDYVFENQRVTKANDTILSQYGVQKEDFLGLTPRDFHRYDIARGKKMWKQLFDKGFFHLDTELVNSTGKKLMIQGDYVCLYDENGRITGHFGIHRDITEDREVQLKIIESEMRFNELAENIEDIVWIRENDQVIYVNSAFEKITGVPKSSLEGDASSLYNIVLEEDMHIFSKSLSKNPNNFNSRYRIRRPDGEIRWIWDRGRTYICPVTNVVRSVGISSDVTIMKTLEKKLKRTANIDGLTQIYNRKYLFDQLEKILDGHKTCDTLFSFSIIDIDFFKHINDNFGHPAGDFILTEFAKLIGDNIRSSDLLGRYGGEEFVVILKGIDKEHSKIVMGKILNIIREKVFNYKDQDISFTFSCGISDVSEFTKEDVTINKIVNCADERLYSAKRSGRNKIISE